jgi:UDP-N-acetylmuramoylalanine--D-glutamate ligase
MMKNGNRAAQRILILGAARQGLALARFLARQGARVTINDQRTVQQLEAAVHSLEGLPVEWFFGSHPVELLDQADLVCLSGGVPLTLPVVAAAMRRGMALSNDSQIFMEAVPCPVIGITGSAGKTTTTTLVGRMAAAFIQAPRRSWVGGNIGLPLIDLIDQIDPSDLVVLELSSFQLELMTRSPQIAAILNITPNHLDRHGTMEAYTAAKAHIFKYQAKENTTILCREDPGSWALADSLPGRLVSFGFARPAPGECGTYLHHDQICLQENGVEVELFPTAVIALRGQHNLLNVLGACAIAAAAGFSPQAMRAGVEGFAGVPHRLELVRMWHGAAWYNDSIATAPERTSAAIQSFQEPVVLLLGGRDKDLPWHSLAGLIHQKVDHVVVFGEAREKILKAIGPTRPGSRPFTLESVQNLQDAVQAASAVVQAGDVVLLSPGGTSFDEFRDFEERGERFRTWVNQLT